MTGESRRYKTLEVLLSIFSVVRLMIPSLNSFVEEELRMLFSKFDWICLFWVPVMNVFGQVLKKKRADVSIPNLIVLASFLVAGVIGSLRLDLAHTKAWVEGLVYTVENGVVISAGAIVGFDIVVGIIRKTFPKLKGIVSEIIAKMKAKKEAKA